MYLSTASRIRRTRHSQDVLTELKPLTTDGPSPQDALPFDAPRRDDYLVYGKPLIGEEEIAEVIATLRSGWIGTGPKVAAFEARMAEYLGIRKAVALSSCTAALSLALRLANVGPGDEVILPSLTFVATANAVVHSGATPVLVDVDPVTSCIDPTAVLGAITPRTKVVLPVHFGGRPCEMDQLVDLVNRYRLTLIEDCAHAIETMWQGHHAGTFGRFGAFSFYVTKNLVTGEGGLVTTNDEVAALRARTLSLHGLSADAWSRFSSAGYRHYEVVEPGFKCNMTDLQASLGLHQLDRLESSLERRAQIWERYDEALADLPLTLPAPAAPDTRHARHLYPVQVDLNQIDASRDDVMAALHRQNIGTGVHYRAVHLHRYYREAFDLRPQDLPASASISERTLSLPITAALTDCDVEDVISAVRRTLSHFAKRSGVRGG